MTGANGPDAASLLAADVIELEADNAELCLELATMREMLSVLLELSHQALAWIANTRESKS